MGSEVPAAMSESAPPGLQHPVHCPQLVQRGPRPGNLQWRYLPSSALGRLQMLRRPPLLRPDHLSALPRHPHHPQAPALTALAKRTKQRFHPFREQGGAAAVLVQSWTSLSGPCKAAVTGLGTGSGGAGRRSCVYVGRPIGLSRFYCTDLRVVIGKLRRWSVPDSTWEEAFRLSGCIIPDH